MKMNFFYIYILLHNLISIKSHLKIEILIESLCPDCINFFEYSFEKFKELQNYNQLAEVVFYPFGNAKAVRDTVNNKWSFTSQHGANECYGNTIQSCIVKKYNDKSHSLLSCMYRKIHSNRENFKSTLEVCIHENFLSSESKNITDDLLKCADEKEGNNYLYEMSQIYVNHKHVPWVIVNGVHDELTEKKVIDNMSKFVCEFNDNSKISESCNHLSNNEYLWDKFDYSFLMQKELCINNFYKEKQIKFLNKMKIK